MRALLPLLAVLWLGCPSAPAALAPGAGVQVWRGQVQWNRSVAWASNDVRAEENYRQGDSVFQVVNDGGSLAFFEPFGDGGFCRLETTLAGSLLDGGCQFDVDGGWTRLRAKSGRIDFNDGVAIAGVFSGETALEDRVLLETIPFAWGSRSLIGSEPLSEAGLISERLCPPLDGCYRGAVHAIDVLGGPLCTQRPDGRPAPADRYAGIDPLTFRVSAGASALSYPVDSQGALRTLRAFNHWDRCGVSASEGFDPVPFVSYRLDRPNFGSQTLTMHFKEDVVLDGGESARCEVTWQGALSACP